VPSVVAVAPININVAELAAIIETALHAEPCTTLAIVTDSQVARAWTRKGWSVNTLATRGIILLQNICVQRHIRLVLTWIESRLNLSDQFTRCDRRTGPVPLTYVRPPRPFETATWS